MDTTRDSLLEWVKDAGNGVAWREFDRIYRPLLRGYAKARGLSRDDADDVAQHCLAVVARKMPGFQYDPGKGKFKGWLPTVVNDAASDVFRRRRREGQARTRDFERADAREAPPDEVWEAEWQRRHLLYCLGQLRAELPAHHYEAFDRHGRQGHSAAQVAADLGLAESTVYTIVHRVRKQVRERMTEFFGDKVANY